MIDGMKKVSTNSLDPDPKIRQSGSRRRRLSSHATNPPEPRRPRSPKPATSSSTGFGESPRSLSWCTTSTWHRMRFARCTGLCFRLPIHFIITNGWFGVDIFFVISGLVIAHSVGNSVITPRYFANFALRRSIRIDPPYWVALIVCVLVQQFGNLVIGKHAVVFPSASGLAGEPLLPPGLVWRFPAWRLLEPDPRVTVLHPLHLP